VLIRPGGRLDVKNSVLTFIIQRVYGVRDFQVVDGPKWISDWQYRFNIQAKTSENVPNDQAKVMAQNLLADRFQLKLHRETRMLRVYSLTATKTGLKIKAAVDGQAPYGRGIENVSPGLIKGQATIADLIGVISRNVDRPVLNRTNFTDMFDFRLEWSSIEAAPEDPRAPLPIALREQLGLQLDAQRAPVEVLVIDHVSQPSQN